MSDNGKGDATIIEFEELETEGVTDTGSTKLSEALKHLKENAPEQYAKVAEILGIKTDLSNEQLLAEITKLMKPEEEEEEEKKKKKDLASYKDFMKKCMEEGKSLKECADEFKSEGGKEAGEAELAEVEELAKTLKKKEDEEEDEYPEPVKKKMGELEAEINKLKEANRLAEITNDVQGLVTERHLAPVQVEPVTKLSAAMDDEMRSDFLDLFRTTQKFKVDQDVGIAAQRKPGDPTDELTPERRAELMETHGLADLIAEKGVKPRNN